MPGEFVLTGAAVQIVGDSIDVGTEEDLLALAGMIITFTSNIPRGRAVPIPGDVMYVPPRSAVVLPSGQISEDGTNPGVTLLANDPDLELTDPLQWHVQPGRVTIGVQTFRPAGWWFNAPDPGDDKTIDELTPVPGINQLGGTRGPRGYGITGDYLGTSASQVAMLALVGAVGDWTIRTDLHTIWVVVGTPTSSLGSWVQLSYPDIGASILKSTVTTKGDLIAGTASAAVARLAAGTNGKSLVADDSQTAGLKYIDTPYVNVKAPPYNAVGDGVANDTTAIQAAITAAASVGGTVWLPVGTYKITSTLTVPQGVSILGAGPELSVIFSGSAIVLMSVSGWAGGYGNRAGKTGGFRLVGGTDLTTYPWVGATATGGLELLDSSVVQRTFENIECRNINGKGYVLDGNQNCTFISCEAEACVTEWYIINGAANNKFVRCEMSTPGTKGIVFTQDNTYPGYARAIYSNIPWGNVFDRCIVEYGTATALVEFIYGQHNTFHDCSIVGYGNAAAHYLVDFGANSSLNKFYNCEVVGDTTLTRPVRNAGYRNQFSDCTFEINGAVAGNFIAATSNYLLIERPAFNVAFAVEYTGVGDARNHIAVTPNPSDQLGTTALRPTFGTFAAPFFYYNTDKDLIEWWTGTGWFEQFLHIPGVPATATSTGKPGWVCYDSSFLYICTATNTWRRVAIASW